MGFHGGSLFTQRRTREEDEDYLQNPSKQAQLHGYEKQIDQLVYRLYDLTLEKIKIVENENS